MTAKTVTVKTAAFAHRTGSLRGTAVSEARIRPVEYSPAVTRMPSTTVHNVPSTEP